MPFDELLRSGADFVIGAQPSKITDPNLSRGVPNPFGYGGWEPNTEVYDSENDPMFAGSRKQVTGTSEYEKQAQDKAVADAKAAADLASASLVNTGGAGGPTHDGSVLSFINAAKTMLGKPYVWGGTTASGVDCSGLIYYALNKAGIKVPRLTAAGYGKMGNAVTRDQARAGDLVYWDEPGPVDHVGIYLGNGMVLQSPQSGDVTKISHVWGNPVYRRILNDTQFGGRLTTPTGVGGVAYGGQLAANVFVTPQITTPQVQGALGVRSTVHVNPAPAVHGTPF